MSTQDASMHTETPQHGKTDAVRVGSREMVGRFRIGLRWTCRYKCFRRAVVWTTWDDLKTAAWEFLTGLLFIPLLVVCPIFYIVRWSITWAIWPFVRKKPFFDMLERQIEMDRDSSPNNPVAHAEK